MNDKSKRDLNKVQQILTGWRSVAPDAVFCEMTLEQFEELVKPSLELERAMRHLKAEMAGLRQQFQASSRGSRSSALKIARAVRAHRDHGENSPLYAAMGYIRESDRKSGLTRKLRKTATPEM